MIQQVKPGARSGQLSAPSSKSQAHRYLICATLSGEKTKITCPGISRDIEATMQCLNGLGAEINAADESISVIPIKKANNNIYNEERILKCGESGSTLRFLLPVAGSLGASAVFHMEGRLSERPMEQYEAVLKEHGMEITREGEYLHCKGKLCAGDYTLPGNVSSQYFSGLLFALPMLDGDSRIHVEGKMESVDYVKMTEAALKGSGIIWEYTEDGYYIPGNQSYKMPEKLLVEGDYSNAAFFLCAGALSEKGITVKNLSGTSGQGDKRITDVLKAFGAYTEISDDAVYVRKDKLHGITIDASMIPDLIPTLCAVASAAEGETRVVNGERLRMKESDRISSTVNMLSALGADVVETNDGMIISGKPELSGGEIDSCNDHRIAMAAAVAASVCRGDVFVNGAQCVAKSYPKFWDDYNSLEVNI